MSTATAYNPPMSDSGDDDALAYREIFVGSILSILLGLCSALILFAAVNSLEKTIATAPLPLFSLLLSIWSFSFVRANADRYTGAAFSVVGMAFSALFLVVGVGYAGFVHVTEVPEGYTRTSFLEIKPSEADLIASRATPQAIDELIDKEAKVFVKGYIRPGSSAVTRNMKNFLLVRDNNECCFGDISKVQYFDQIQVALGPGLTADDSRRLFRVGGVLKKGDPNRDYGAPVTYILEADYIR